ncbi:carbohydrate porin [Dyella sp.]|jgi:porin|uniref:carbohydrate porin n=1 Tax=Dyella sp. TaxID=1869338 RepID=UPI002D767679|nr:carbohydrate porin [Dyella sp.]HET6434082.1 carbohydrate porin [Dyella sp.]
MRPHLLATAIALCTAALALPAHADDSYAANTLSGNWGGTRTRLHERGVDLTADYVGEWLHNTAGGTRHASAYADQIHLGAAFDFARLWGWQGASLHVDVTNRNGHQLDQRAGLGTLLETHEIYGAGKVARLTRLFLEQSLWDGLVDLKYGRMDLNTDFYSLSCDFENLSFCGSLPGYITQGWYSWPVSQTGGVVRLHPASAWYAKVGAFDVNANNALPSQGLKLSAPGRSQGTLTIAEAGWDTSLDAGSHLLPGSWRIGAWRNSASYPDLLLDVNGQPQVLTGADALQRNHTSGTYALVTQQVTHNSAGGGLSLFGNLVDADAHTDHTDQMISAGLLYAAPFAGRPRDRIGLAVGRNRVSRRVTRAARLANAAGLAPRPVPGSEYVTELNYQWQAAPGVTLMPSVQFVRHPGGDAQAGSATVLGLRVAAAF